MKRSLLFISIILFLCCLRLSGLSTSVTPENAKLAPQPTITAGQATGAISACEGSAAASPNIQQFTVSGANLTGGITATTVAGSGFEVSLTPGSGYANSVTLSQSSGTVSNGVVYVRSDGSSPAGNISGNVVLTSPGAASQNVAVSATIDPLPTVNAVPDQVVINNQTSNIINFSGLADYYKWTNDNPAIGLATSGTGDIRSFIAVNTGTKPITATVTVTPYFAGFAYIGNDGDRTVSVFNTHTNQKIARIPVGAGPESVCVSPDGKRAYAANFGSNSISVINTATNTVLATIPAGVNPWGVSVSQDSKKIYVADAYGDVLVIDAATYKQLAKVSIGAGAIAGAVSPDGSFLYVPDDYSPNGGVAVISTATNAVLSEIPVGSQPYGIAVTPDGKFIYVANYSSADVSVVDTKANKEIDKIHVGVTPTGVCITPDGKFVYVAVEFANYVEVISTADNSVIRTIPASGQPFGISITPDGTEVYVVNDLSESVDIISTATNTVISTVQISATEFGPISVGQFITGGRCPGNPITFTFTINPTPAPVIIASGTPSPLTTVYGTPSSSTTFDVSGTNLTAGVLVTPPPGFEVSTDDVNFSPVATVGNDGAISNPQVYIRLAATTHVGNYSGNITLSTTGAQNVIVLMLESTVTPAPLTITADDKFKVFETPNPVLTASYTGFKNGDAPVNLISLPQLNTIAVITSPIGQYPITIIGGLSPDYTITLVPGVLTVVGGIVVPNTFTPNGDGINDSWIIKYLNSYLNCTVQIYNRYGENVYSSIGYGIPWDGTHKGGALPTGTYYYIINLKNGLKALSGFVTIIR